MDKIEFKVNVTAKFLPVTATKPARYAINVNGKRVIKSQHLVDDVVDFPYVAQALAELCIKEFGLTWKIKAATILSTGLYVFVIE